MNSNFIGSLRAGWDRHRVTLLRVAIIVLFVLALLKLGTESYRLLGDTSHKGAIDLKQRQTEVQNWFAGRRVYGVVHSASYPPASYAMLWPLIGWLAFTPARWVWAASTAAALGGLTLLIVRHSGASSRLERIFVALLPLSMNATGVAIGNGQLPLHVLVALVAGLVLLHRARGLWRVELGSAMLILAAFVKPNMAIPFFWLACFIPGTLRPALLIGAGYVALTLLAVSFQPSGLAPLLQDWAAGGVQIATGASTEWSYANLHSWAAVLGLEKWNTSVSLLALAGLGLWVYWHRHADLWLLLGVTALLTRLWTYHGIYDDVLILLPMLALFRVAKQSRAADGGVVAGILLASTTLAMLAPARLLFSPQPWRLLFAAVHAIIWLAVLMFLLERAHRDKRLRVCA